jgi:toxin ParE1/3/4
MGHVIWSTAALEDVDSIADYISHDSPHQAALFVSRLIQATERLAEFPRSGRIIPEIGNPACREILYGSHRIMYRVDGPDVWVTGVVHGARNWLPE